MSLTVSTSQNTDKIKEMILYISLKSAGDYRFGMTKLNKLIAFSDMYFYQNSGKSITNAELMKEKYGPVLRCMKPVREEMMLQDKSLALVTREVALGMFSQVPTPLRRPNLNLFSADEIAMIDNVLDTFKEMNNTQIAQYSHDNLVAWQNLGYRETIPLGTIFYPVESELRPDDIEFFQRLWNMEKWSETHASQR